MKFIKTVFIALSACLLGSFSFAAGGGGYVKDFDFSFEGPFGAYDQTPIEMSELIENYLKENIINIVGGCCGTKPEHIRLIAEVARNYKPRKI